MNREETTRSRAFTRPEPSKAAPNAGQEELDRLALLKTDDEEFIPRGACSPDGPARAIGRAGGGGRPGIAERSRPAEVEAIAASMRSGLPDKMR